MFATPDPSRSSPLARNLRLLQIEAGPHNARVFNRPVISRLVQGSPTSTPVIPYAVSGVTPARAGFTPAAPGTSSARTDHPRSRGVYAAQPRQMGLTFGSSPLARGLPPPPALGGGAPGIIPARAGFTLGPLIAGPGGEDHPRSRGVYPRMSPVTETVQGSSPLARGLLDASLLSAIEVGIIPARAGFTESEDCGDNNFEDHPRSRGVYRTRTRARCAR